MAGQGRKKKGPAGRAARIGKVARSEGQRRSPERDEGIPPPGSFRLDIYLSVKHPDYPNMENQFFIDQATHDRMRKRPQFLDELREQNAEVLEALRLGQDAAVFEALQLHGLLVLRTGDNLDSEFGEFQRLAWARINSWYDKARIGATRQAREAAIQLLRRLAIAFVPERRGRKRPEERASARDVYEYYQRYLFRLSRARKLLHDWPWRGRLGDRARSVARACDVEADHLAHFLGDDESEVVRIVRLQDAARIATAHAFRITQSSVGNYLTRALREPFRLGQPVPPRPGR